MAVGNEYGGSRGFYDGRLQVGLDIASRIGSFIKTILWGLYVGSNGVLRPLPSLDLGRRILASPKGVMRYADWKKLCHGRLFAGFANIRAPSFNRHSISCNAVSLFYPRVWAWALKSLPCCSQPMRVFHRYLDPLTNRDSYDSRRAFAAIIVLSDGRESKGIMQRGLFCIRIISRVYQEGEQEIESMIMPQGLQVRHTTSTQHIAIL